VVAWFFNKPATLLVGHGTTEFLRLSNSRIEELSQFSALLARNTQRESVLRAARSRAFVGTHPPEQGAAHAEGRPVVRLEAEALSAQAINDELRCDGVC